MRLWLHLCTNTHQAVLHFKMTFLREKMVKSAITFRGAWAYLPHWGLGPVVCDSSQCSVRPTLTFPAVGHHHPLASTNSYCLVTEARVWTTCLRLLPYSGTDGSRTCNFSTNAVTITLPCHMTKASKYIRHFVIFVIHTDLRAIIYVQQIRILCRSVTRPVRHLDQWQSAVVVMKAYRIEPMVIRNSPVKPVLMPHHKGRKRLHLGNITFALITRL